MPDHGEAERRQLRPIGRDAVRRAARDAVVRRPGLELAHDWLAVAAGGHLGEELIERHRLEDLVAREPVEQRIQERGRGLPPRRRRHDDAARRAEEGILEVDEGEPGQQLLGREDRIARSGGEVRAEVGVGGGGGHGGAVREVQREGLSEGLVALPARGEVGVADDHTGRPGQLQARGQAGAVALGEGGCGVDPGACVGLEAGGAQQLVAAPHLCADFVGDARFGERHQVDGDVGLVEELIATQRIQLVECVLALMRAAAGQRADRQRAHGERRRPRRGAPPTRRWPW